MTKFPNQGKTYDHLPRANVIVYGAAKIQVCDATRSVRADFVPVPASAALQQCNLLLNDHLTAATRVLAISATARVIC